MEKIEITEVEIVPVKPRHGHIAFASCVLNGVFFLGDIAVIKTDDGGYRLSFPAKIIKNKEGQPAKDSNGKILRFFTYHPIKDVANKALENAIFPEVKRVTNK